MKKYICTICGYIYDEAKGIPEAGIAAGTKWEELPDNWKCPLCGAAKSDFKEQKNEAKPASKIIVSNESNELNESEELREMFFGEMSALCSNLARGCEKQYLPVESELFTKLANYYKSKIKYNENNDLTELTNKIENNLENSYPVSNDIAENEHDRGAKRVLVWSEKVTRMLNSLLNRYEEEKDEMFQNTSIYVCEICGFIYVGNELPEICPVCKVPNKKFAKIERR